MMFGNQDSEFRPGLFCGAYPLPCVKLRRIEYPGFDIFVNFTSPRSFAILRRATYTPLVTCLQLLC